VNGVSLVDALIATGVLATGIAALLQLFVIAARANVDARDATYATVLAAQKIEELRAGPLPESTTSIDFPDAQGRALADGARARAARYQRRWTVAPLSADPVDTVVITVVVSRRGAPDRAVRLATVRTRRAE
jgi:Tfp pilus assembly protein PilV